MREFEDQNETLLCNCCGKSVDIAVEEVGAVCFHCGKLVWRKPLDMRDALRLGFEQDVFFFELFSSVIRPEALRQLELPTKDSCCLAELKSILNVDSDSFRDLTYVDVYYPEEKAFERRQSYRDLILNEEPTVLGRLLDQINSEAMPDCIASSKHSRMHMFTLTVRMVAHRLGAREEIEPNDLFEGPGKALELFGVQAFAVEYLNCWRYILNGLSEPDREEFVSHILNGDQSLVEQLSNPERLSVHDFLGDPRETPSFRASDLMLEFFGVDKSNG